MTSVIAALTFGGKWKIYNKDPIKTLFQTLNIVKILADENQKKKF